MSKNPKKKKYKDMKIGQKAARIGLDSEKDIQKAINKNEHFKELIKNCLNNLTLESKRKIKTKKKKRLTKKDITIDIGDSSIGVSIKSSKRTSFHQVDRRRLEDWKDFLNMHENIYEIIKEAALRISNNPQAKFIKKEDQDTIKNFFQENYKIMLKEIFTRDEEDLILLLINNKMNKTIYIFKIQECLKYVYCFIHFIVDQKQN
jgi:hypothetical protein